MRIGKALYYTVFSSGADYMAEINNHQEKSQAALTSVLAAIGLTLFKIIVGFSTGSLGILAEAAHSGLDLIAALVTLAAVKLSGRPADETHHYGHGKIENLSALFETLLLLITSVWIIYEAVHRLMTKSVEVEVTVWAYIVMAVSIVIDINRSRMLYKAAEKFNSQALEADALHFSTDIWSSAVVLVGLLGVTISTLIPGLEWLKQADAVAAIGVAFIVIFVSYNLGRRTIEELLDKAPNGRAKEIKAAVEAVPGIVDCHRIRIRAAGPENFIDAHILVDPDLAFESVHELTDRVEKVIQGLVPGADITVHPEPAERSKTAQAGKKTERKAPSRAKAKKSTPPA